jgi:hypothetical protein
METNTTETAANWAANVRAEMKAENDARRARWEAAMDLAARLWASGETQRAVKLTQDADTIYSGQEGSLTRADAWAFASEAAAFRNLVIRRPAV